MYEKNPSLFSTQHMGKKGALKHSYHLAKTIFTSQDGNLLLLTPPLFILISHLICIFLLQNIHFQSKKEKLGINLV